MADYYSITFNPKFKERLFLDTTNDKNGNYIYPWNFLICKKWKNNETVILRIHSFGIELPFTFGASNIPIIREDLLLIIKSMILIDEIQLIPVKIESLNSNFYILNVLAQISCIDEKNSIFDKYTEKDGISDRIGKYKGFIKLKLNKEKIGDKNFFRPLNWEVELIIHERIKNILYDNNIIGLNFTKVT